MHHSFDIEIARQYGINVAIFLNNMYFWIQKNQLDNTNFYEGRYWTYNTSKYFTSLFVYWSEDQIDRVIKKCVEEGLILTGNFNANRYDRTRWYAFTEKGYELSGLTLPQNCGMETPKTAGCTFREIAEPIPDINTDINTDTKSFCSSGDELNIEEECFNRFWEGYPRKEAKRNAMKAWKKIKQKDYEQIISDIALRKNHNWKGKSKQYIPLPASYLNGQRWNDELIHGEPQNAKRENASEKSARILTDDLRKSQQRNRDAENAINIFLS